ncbi:MAG: SDR family oxidoreductase [Bacillota bacterium]
MLTYLVTGGAGFIGSNIVEELVRRGEKVRVLDNLSTGKKENLAHLTGVIELIEGDITNPGDVTRAVKGIDFVLHQAALPSVPRSIEDPLTTNEVNITGTLNLLRAAREHKVKRLVYASSSSAYGNIPTLPKSEDLPAQPLSPYAVSKYAGELYCGIFYPVYGLETVALRYFNVFGPRQDPDSMYAAVVPRFITALIEGKPPVVYGDGEQSRDFTYVGNVVEANIQACFAPEAAGKVFNIGCGRRITLNELLDVLKQIIKSDVIPVHREPRPGDVRHSLADITRARESLGYEPAVSLQEGLEKTVAWFSNNM